MDLSSSLKRAMNHGKQIRLFLTDGSASGIRYAELMNWTGQAFACPKSLFSKLKEWPETQRAGVYILIGLNDKGEDTVYIGESENVGNRVMQHLGAGTLDEIVVAVFFTSKDDNLTKGHITLLEQRLAKRAGEAKRYAVQFGREPSEKTLSKPEAATMEEFLENIYLVSSALGFVVFEMPPTAQEVEGQASELSFELENGVKARGFDSEEGFVVKAGSQAAANDVGSLQPGYKGLKEELKQKNLLVPDGAHLKFAEDYTFTSSSAAAGVVSGSQRSGPKSWKNKDGKTLAELEAAEAVQSQAAEPLAVAQV
jgi:hypothetical protein